MHPDLQRALDDVAASVAGMTAEQMNTGPAGKWSTALILEHLRLSLRTSGARLASAVADGTPTATPGTWKERLGAFVVVGLGYFPTGRIAPAYVEPKGMPGGNALEAVRGALEEFDDIASRCALRFGPDTKVANHPILGAFSVTQWRRFHRVHTRHHMKQVARLRAQP
jgi:hypothetical protein